MELDFLGPLLDRPGPWASVCVDTAGNTEEAAGRRARAVRAELMAQGADPATRQAVHDALARPHPTGERPGRAVYATGGQVVLDAPLGTAPKADLVSWSALPRLTTLVELTAEDPACLVVYLDDRGADFELRAALGTAPAGRAQRPEPFAGSPVESAEHHASDEEIAEVVADRLSRVWQECHADVVLLAGEPGERRQVHDRLPDPVRAVTAESEHGGRRAPAPLERDIARVRAECAREHAADVLERYRAERARAVCAPEEAHVAEGVHALVEAAREHRIAALLIEPGGPDLGCEVWVGPDPDQVAEERAEGGRLGWVEPVAARADDALLRSAAATGAEVLRVSGARAPASGLGALLRWPEPTG
jgi:hypothetical protein